MTLGRLRSLIRTTSDSPIEDNAHDLKQICKAVGSPQLQKSEGLTKEVCGSSKRAFDEHKLEKKAKDERPQIFLSYSNERRDFARLLYEGLKSSNYIVVDQDSINFAEVVDQCQLAIVVLSDMYVKSKPLMSKLCTIVKSKKTNNPTLKVYPVFYKLTLDDLPNAYIPISTFDGEGSSLDIASEREGLNFVCEGKNEISRKTNDLVENLSQGRVDVGKFCEEFSELQRNSWPSNGLEFERNDNSEEGYVHTRLEEIFHYMLVTKDCNNDQILGHQGKLEMESKLSLRQMKCLLESLPMTEFYLQRKFNMAQSLQEKYIEYSSFENMCLYLDPYQKHEYSKGRIVAALFPTTFLYHFKVYMFQGPHHGNFRPMLKATAAMVVEKIQKECKHITIQSSIFVDFVDYDAPLDPSRTIAMCQTFSTRTRIGEELQGENSIQYCIVQYHLTGAYYFECDNLSNLDKPIIDKSVGVIGVKVTSSQIQVEMMWEDGSYYFGPLEDFSYDYELDDNKQCALEAFGGLKGAHFLRTCGLKCSPFLVIALAMAIQKKGMALTWSNGKGHIQSNSTLSSLQPMESEVWECQILYGANTNQLGEAVEWGMNQIDQNCASCRRDNQCQVVLEKDPNESFSISNDSSLDSWSSDEPNDTSNYTPISVDLGALANQFHAGAQNKQKVNFGVKVLGIGPDFGFEVQNSKGKQVEDQAFERIQQHYWENEGGFVIANNLKDEHQLLQERLFQGSLYAEPDLNYLVVYDSCKTSHVSIYWVKESNNEPKLELKWITDIFVKQGLDRIEKIFRGLKGRTLEVTRRGTEYLGTIFQQQPKGLMKRFVNRISSKETCKDNGLQMVSILEVHPQAIISNDEWRHIVGQQPYEPYKFFLKASYMKAITYSKTIYSSGFILSTHTTKEYSLKWGRARRKLGHVASNYVHDSEEVKSCAKFSKPPHSLSSKWHEEIYWGGFK